MLHVKGVLNIDDPVSKYFDDWPEFKHTVTLRHLLTHTSGYREAYTISNLAGRIIGRDRLSRKECIEVVRKQSKLEFIPGSRLLTTVLLGLFWLKFWRRLQIYLLING